MHEAQWLPQQLCDCSAVKWVPEPHPSLGPHLQMYMCCHLYSFWFLLYLSLEQEALTFLEHMHVPQRCLYMFLRPGAKGHCIISSLFSLCQALHDPSSHELDLVCPFSWPPSLHGSLSSPYLISAQSRQIKCPLIISVHCGKENHKHLECGSVPMFDTSLSILPRVTTLEKQTGAASGLRKELQNALH